MTITFTNAHLFTGTEWLPNATVRVADGRIQAINPSAPTHQDAETTTVIDLNGSPHLRLPFAKRHDYPAAHHPFDFA